MASGRPLFPGSAVESQLELIFRMLGTPTETRWPGVTSYKSFEPLKLAVYKPESLVTSVPRYLSFRRMMLGLPSYDVRAANSFEKFNSYYNLDKN